MTYDLTGLDATEIDLAKEAIAESNDSNAPGICQVLENLRSNKSQTERASILTRLRRVLFNERKLMEAQNMNEAWPKPTNQS